MDNNNSFGEVECKRLRYRHFMIRSILKRSLSEGVPLREVLGADVDDKRKFPKLIALLPPLPDCLTHLKRINGSRIIISEHVDTVDEDLLQKIKNLISEAQLIRIKVPSIKPETRAQFAESKKIWLSSFHENKILEKKLADNLFNDRWTAIYGDLFMAIEPIKGGLIYNPVKKEIVVGPVSANYDHPLEHCTMRLVRELAALHLKGGSERMPLDGKSYLAKGLDIILYEEPCTMCAMALVHSRIDRVFFGCLNARVGAIATKWRLQEEPYINHHYESADSLFYTHPAFRICERQIDENVALPAKNVVTKQYNYEEISSIAYEVEQVLTATCPDTSRQKLVGVAIKRNAKFVAAIIGHIEKEVQLFIIGRSGNAFFTLDPPQRNSDGFHKLSDYALKKCHDYGVEIIISTEILDNLSSLLDVPNENEFKFSKFTTTSERFIPAFDKAEDRICYAIQTSGSTGVPKIVHVPLRAILPNIFDFGNRFQINEHSRVLFSTNLFFDPSIVEIFLAARFGAELAILPDQWNAYSSLLESFICENRIFDFVQLTPSVLQRFRPQFLLELFGRLSPVRNIVIGGEPFPLSLVRHYRAEDCSANIYNVYGVTEVSCWASCYHYTSQNEKISIGEPLLNTHLDVDESSGALLIGGTRKCYINFQFSDTSHIFETADCAVFTADSDGKTLRRKINLLGRRDKPNGMLQFSAEVENLFLDNFPEITFAKLIFLENCAYLFVSLANEESSVGKVNSFSQSLPQRLRVRRIFFNIKLDHFITPNGKIDDSKLKEYCKAELRSTVSDASSNCKDAWEFLGQLFGDLKEFPLTKNNLSAPLRSLGLASLEITELAFLIEDAIQENRRYSVLASNDFLEIIQLLLDERRTNLSTLLNIIEEVFFGNGHNKNYKFRDFTTPLQNGHIETVCRERQSCKLTIKEKWSSNLRKCVDASPILLYQDAAFPSICVGSHAGCFRCFDLISGEEYLQFDVPNGEAIEAKCAVGNRFVVFGTLSGSLYVFERLSHNIFGVVQSGGEIRASPVIFQLQNSSSPPSEVVAFACYDGYLRIFNIVEQAMELPPCVELDVAVSQPEFGLVRSTPFLHLTNEGLHAIVATLYGYVISFDANLCKRLWSVQMDGPIFADLIALPVKEKTNELLVIVTVKGTVSIIDITTGEEISKLSLPSVTIFDAPSFVFTEEDENCFLLLAHCDRIIVLSHISTKLRLHRVIKLDAKNFTTVRSPIVVDEHVFVLSTNGVLLRLRLIMPMADNSFYEKLLNLEEATFGSPIVVRQKANTSGNGQLGIEYRVVIGTRADYVRCFSVLIND